MISVILVVFVFIIYLRLDNYSKFVLFSLSALFPLSFGNFRSIPEFMFIEWITIVTFLILINRLNPVFSNEKNIKLIKFKGIEIFIFAIMILAALVLNNFLQNEVFSKSVVSTDARGVKRLYFNIFNYILLFFTTIIFIVSYYDKLNFEKFFKIIVYFAIFVGYLRILSYFLKFDIPFLGGLYHYDSDPYRLQTYGGAAYRISGLDTTSIIGIPAYFAYYIFKGKINIFLLSSFLVFTFLSGGRTVMVGVTISIVLFSFFFLPKNFMYLITAGGLFILFFLIFVPNNVLQGQTGRLTTFNSGNFMGQDVSRGLAWKLYLESFYKNPLFGKGIGEYQGYILPDTPGASLGLTLQYAGGHGSYLSLLGIFGIAGLIYFLIWIFGGIILSYRKIKKYVDIDRNKTAIAVFCFMILIIKSIDCITAGNGMNMPILFFIVGLITSLTVLDNIKEKSVNEV